MIVKGSIVVTLDGFGNIGAVDANGHFERIDEEGCSGHIIGDIDETGHASGTATLHNFCGCIDRNWDVDRVP